MVPAGQDVTATAEGERVEPTAVKPWWEEPGVSEEDRRAAQEEADAERAAMQAGDVDAAEDTGPEPPDIFAPAPSTTETNEQRIARLQAEADKQEAEREARVEAAKRIAKANFDSALDQVNDPMYGGDIGAALDSYYQNTVDTLAESGETDPNVISRAITHFEQLAAAHRAKQAPAAVPAVQENTAIDSVVALNAELAKQTTRAGYDNIRNQLIVYQGTLGVSNETAAEVKKENPTEGIELDGWVEDGQLWDGATYYAGTPETYGSGINRQQKFPVALVPINTLEEANDAESKGMAIYVLNKPEQQTVPELEKQIATLKGERNKLLTPTGREPKPGTKKRTQWDLLTRKMDDLWGQISAIESGRVTPASAPQLTNEPYTIEGEVRVISETKDKDDFGNAVTQIEFSNGSKYQIIRLDSLESMGLPGWHDANKFGPTEGGFLGNTKAEALQELTRRETEKQKAQPQLTNEPYTIDVEARVVSDAVNNQLSPDELRRLTTHYGLSPSSEKFLQRVKDDIVRFATEGASAVASSIRDIIQKLHAGVLSVAMIFNPMNISMPEFVAYPKATVTRTEAVYAKLPDGLEEMSEGGKEAYRTLYAAIGNKLRSEDKLFTIADKPTGHTYVFLPNGKLLLKTKTLFGKAYGDFYKGNNTLPQNRITPAGLFTFGLRDATRSPDEARTAGEYDTGKVFVLDKVIGGQYSMTVMHSVWLHESDAKARAEALKSPDQTDSRYSFGCINVDKPTYKFLVDNHLKQMDGSSVFIVPDNPANLADLLSGKPENRDGLERNTFTPATQDVVEEADSAKQDPTVVAEKEADRRRTIFRSIVLAAESAAASAAIDISDLVKANMTGINKIVQLYKDGKISLEQFAEQMLRIQERIADASAAKRNAQSQRQRGYGRVISALEAAKNAGRISPRTADFAIWFLNKNPALAADLAIEISIPKNKSDQGETENTGGYYDPFETLVRIITRKDKGTGAYADTSNDVAVHEILHHLERMLPFNMRKMIRNEWAKQFKAATAKATKENNKPLMDYLAALAVANATGSAVAFKAASQYIVDGSVPQHMYALFNPSEFWAVRGSGILAGRYDASSKGRFAKIAQFMREFVHAIKSIFGMQSNHPIIKGLDAVLRGDGTFVTDFMLADAAPSVMPKQLTPKGLHPDVSDAINRNDINGALQAVARNTSGFYSELAKRLAALKLPTNIIFNNQRNLVKKVIDDRSTPQQLRLFAYLSRVAPEFYDRYFKDYDKAENLERVYEGLRKLPGSGINIAPVNTELADVRYAFNKSMPGLTAPGFFAPTLDTVNIAPDGSFGTNYRVLLHEVVHAATDYLLAEKVPLTPEQAQAKKDLLEMYAFAQTKLPPGEYGFTNISEFVAEVMTNKKFQDKLKSIAYPPRKTTLFNRFLQVIAEMFGLDNLAGASMSAINELLSAQRPSGIASMPLVFAQGKKRVRGPISKPDSWRTAEAVQTSIQETIANATKGRVPLDEALKDLFNSLWSANGTAVRAVILPVLQLRQLKDITRTKFPQFAAAVSIVEKMVAYRGQKIKIAEDIVQNWTKLQSSDPKQSSLMGRIMLEATIRARDPDDGVPPGGAPDALDNAWAALDPEFKQLYRQVRGFYADSVKEMVRTMKQRALGLPKAQRQAMIRKIDEQFGPTKLAYPYFPLRRFGSNWFQIGKGNFKEFYTFEGSVARNLAFYKRRRQLQKGNAKQQAAAETMRMGNGISELYSQNLATTQVLRDVESTIDNLTATDAAGIKAELKDSLNQLIYLLLPQQSMRKMFINRRAIQGASGDMLRVFAHTAVHSAYQQARFKFADPFLNNINNARSYIDELEASKAINPEQGAVYRDYVRELEDRTKIVLGVEDTSALARVAGAITNTTFFFMLSAPASALLNIVGMATLTMPRIGAKYGYAKTNALMLKNAARYAGSTPTRTLAPLVTGQFMQVSFPSIVEGGKLSPLLQRAADRFVDDGDINISMTNDVFDLGERPSALYTGKTNTAKKLMSGLFHQAERLNREVALLTAFELAYEKFLATDRKDIRGVVERDPATGNPVKYTPDEAFDLAIQEARDIAGLTLGDFTRQMKGKVFAKYPGLNVLAQFKQYAITTTYNVLRDLYEAAGRSYTKAEVEQFRQQMAKDGLSPAVIDQRIEEANAYRKEIYREAFRRMAGVLGMAYLFGGVVAQPFFSLLGTLIGMFAPDDDDEFFDWENWFYNFMASDVGGAAAAIFTKMGMDAKESEKAGKQLGLALARGPVATLTGTALADRVSLDLKNLWWREGRYSPDAREAIQQEMIANFGPSAGLALNWADAWQLAGEGQYLKAYEKAAPAIFSKPATAYRLGTEGATNRAGDVVGGMYADQFTTWQLAMQSIGLQPEKLALAQKAAIQAKTYQQKVLDRRTALLNRLWMERGTPGFADAMQKANEFSLKYPEARIDGKAIEKSFDARAEARAQAEAMGAKLDKKLLGRTLPMMYYGMD
jgi:hypothetical protein